MIKVKKRKNTFCCSKLIGLTHLEYEEISKIIKTMIQLLFFGLLCGMQFDRFPNKK